MKRGWGGVQESAGRTVWGNGREEGRGGGVCKVTHQHVSVVRCGREDPSPLPRARARARAARRARVPRRSVHLPVLWSKQWDEGEGRAMGAGV